MLKNFKNIHSSEADLRTLENTWDKTVYDNYQLVEVVNFCYKEFLLRCYRRPRSIFVIYSIVYIKPKFGTKILQILQG